MFSSFLLHVDDDFFGARDGKYTRRKVNMGAKTLWRGESRKLSRVMRRGHVSKITFKGESTVS